MRVKEPIQDPMGHWVHFRPSFFGETTLREFEELKPVITNPTFIITVKKEAIYFLKLINDDINMLIETRADKGNFLAINCIENPSVDYISALLRKGGLMSFSSL